MRHFKTSLIAMGIALVLAMATGAYGLYSIDQTGRTRSEKTSRAQLLGQGLGIAVGVVVAPFWIYGASKFGEERRAARLESPASSKKQAASESAKSRRKDSAT